MKKNCKINIQYYHCKGNHSTALSYQRQKEIVTTMEFRETPLNYHKEITKIVKRTNKIKFNMKMERVKNVCMMHESNVEEKLLCLLEANTSIILQTPNATAANKYENKISMVKVLLDPNKPSSQKSWQRN